jgi:hypothetical protein
LRTPAPNNLPMLTSLIEIRVVGAKIDSIGLLGRIHRMILREID